MSGEVPEGWAKRALSDLLVRDTSAVSISELHAAGKVWHYSIPAFDEFHAPVEADGVSIKSNKTRVNQDSVLFSKLNPRTPRVWRVKGLNLGLSVCSTEFWCLKQRSKSVDLDFMSLFLSSSLFLGHPSIKPSSSTNSHQRVDRKAFDRFEVCLPPLPEQQKIAEILTSVDDAIQATEAVIEQTKKVKQGVMNRLLTKGIGHSRFKKTEIGEIPEEWEVVRLEELVSRVDSGWSPNCPKEPAPENKWGVLKTSAVTWDGFDSAANKRLPDNLTPKPSMEVRAGDVLITRAGPKDRTGVVAFVRSVRPKLMLSDKIIRLSTDPHTTDPEFLSYLLSSPHGQGQLMQKKSGMAESQTNISQAIVRETLIAAPPVSEQKKIVKILSGVEGYLQELRAERAGFVTLKSAVMMDLLTGRKRVTL